MVFFDIAKISNFTPVELEKYEAIMMNEYDYKAIMDYAKKESFEEGKKEGINIGEKKNKKENFVKGILQTAKFMLKDGLDPARVARITKLPKKQIMALKY